jgi:hypothetical protein
MSKELAILSPHRIAELAERFDGRANIAHINKHFRYQDESHKWPIQGMFDATERAIRRLRRAYRHEEPIYGLAYALALDAEISRIVNGYSQ